MMNSKTFRLFISSTFSDFLTEREILNENIYRKMNGFCQSRGYHFQLIDLRWGVNSEAALMQNTLQICLSEVRRCTELAPRPNLLLMVGERYGWIPLPSRIARKDLEGILLKSSEEEKAVLREWYYLDGNECDGAFFLKSRSGEFEDDQQWGRIEDRLREILIRGGTSCGFGPEQMMDLTSSATEREIVEGLLGKPGICDNAIAVLRTGYPQRDSDQTQMETLRSKISRRMQQDFQTDNIVELVFDGDYAARFEEIVSTLLQRNIEREIQRLESLAKESEEDYVPQAILNKCGGTYFARQDMIRELDNYVHGTQNVPMFLVGESGSGKSTLLADYINQSSVPAFYVFAGYGKHSYSLNGAISHINEQIHKHYHISGKQSRGSMGARLSDTFHAIDSKETILLIIDGLDTFYDLRDIHENVFPSQLPAHVRLIVSSADRCVVEQFRSSTSKLLEIGSFLPDDSWNILMTMLSVRGRCIANPAQAACVKQALCGGATPLQLTLLSSLCSQWRSDENHMAVPMEKEELALLYIRNLFKRYGHDEELVLYALALVAVSPAGITEDMLQRILPTFESVKDRFLKEDRYAHDLRKLPFVIWSRLFYDFQDGLEYAFSGGTMVVRIRHNVFLQTMKRNYPDYCEKAAESLICYYWNQQHCTSGGHPNILKLQTLPVLLKEKGDTHKLGQLLADLVYVDSAVRAGYLDETIEDLSVVVRTEGGSSVPHVLKILHCLQDNRERLSCYRRDFLNCAYDDGLAEETLPILTLEKKRMEAQRLYFPHSAQSSVAWLEGGSHYTVLEDNEIYVYDAELNIVRTHINVVNDVPEKNMTVNEVIWIHRHRIAAVTDVGQILIYDLGENRPRLQARMAYDASMKGIRCVPGQNLLIYPDEGQLCVRNMLTGELQYQISLNKRFKAGFDIDLAERELIVWKRKSYISVFDLDTGKEKYKQKIRFSGNLMQQLFIWSGDMPSVKKLGQRRWLLYCPDQIWYAVADGGRPRYLLPPSIPGSDKKKDDLPGKRTYIVVWEHLLMLLDFADGYHLRYYPVRNISSVAWIQVDEKLSVVTDQGLVVIRVGDFRQLDAERAQCYSSKMDLRNTIPFFLERADNNSKIYQLIFSAFRMFLMSTDEDMFRYSIIFSFKELETGSVHYANNKANLVVWAGDGKKAVAYEGKDTIVIFDADANAKVVVDKLKLALNNNILGLAFSPDGGYLLIWRNHWVDVIDAVTGRYALRINIGLRPALQVRFLESGKLSMVLCDRKEYTFTYSEQSCTYISDQLLPEKLVSAIDLDAYFGPYAVYPADADRKTSTFIGADFFENAVIRNLSDTRVYQGGKHWLLYRNGEFYLDGKMESVFSHPYTDFGQSLMQERKQAVSQLYTYLREKNDLFSVLYEPDENHLILVSRLLNSVIVFDIDRMCVAATYKVTGNIIGIRDISTASITLSCDGTPDNICIKLNLP